MKFLYEINFLKRGDENLKKQINIFFKLIKIIKQMKVLEEIKIFV